MVIKMLDKKICINRKYTHYFEFMDAMVKAYKNVHNHKISKKTK